MDQSINHATEMAFAAVKETSQDWLAVLVEGVMRVISAISAQEDTVRADRVLVGIMLILVEFLN